MVVIPLRGVAHVEQERVLLEHGPLSLCPVEDRGRLESSVLPAPGIDSGHIDMIEAMEAYHRLGFEGTFIDDHVPGVVGDTNGLISRAHAMGYIRALIDTVTRGG